MPPSSSVLVLNPSAGSVDDPRDIAGEVASHGSVNVRLTAGEGDARRFAREAAESGTRHLWVAGGDGTLHEVVLGLHDSGAETLPILHPIPLGTGNDLVRSLEIPLDWSEAVAALAASSRTRELNVMEVTLDAEERVGINAVIVGNGGRVGEVLDAEGKSWWGPLAYLRAAVEVAMELQPIRVRLEVDGEESWSGSILNVVVANGRYAGHGIPIAPGAHPDDDALELVTVAETSLAGILGLMPALLGEQDPEHEAYRHRTVTSVRVEAEDDQRLPVSVDGENAEARRITVRLSDGRIPVRIPDLQD
jgi:YegS/Rv2252/BmrU family lipid kinase